MKQRRDRLFTLIVFVLTVIIFLIPQSLQNKQDKELISARARILKTDNSETEQYGIIRTGNQGVTIKILNGEFKGLIVDSNNILIGKLELDKMFAPGDLALVNIDVNDQGEFVYASVVDHYRLHVELILILLFTAILIAFARWTGVKAMLSFVFTGAILWKFLFPGFLMGINPILLSLVITILLSACIIFLVGGVNRKGLVAFLGAVSGVLLTCVFSLVFGKAFNIHGAVKPFSETLLYAGYAHLDLSAIFLSGIFLASSGAVMDIAMDISASMREVKHKRPDITTGELIKSGLRVGHSVVGTMTTTLLLAYTGGYTAMMMVFIAQGTPSNNILNLTYVSAEVLHTMVGSFGLVLVAPLTAVIGGWIYSKSKNQPGSDY